MSDKKKIIAYIDKLLEKYPKNYHLLMVAEFIDSLQEEPVSEDLEKEIAIYLGDDWKQDTPIEVQRDMIGYAKYFFELGLKVKEE